MCSRPEFSTSANAFAFFHEACSHGNLKIAFQAIPFVWANPQDAFCEMIRSEEARALVIYGLDINTRRNGLTAAEWRYVKGYAIDHLWWNGADMMNTSLEFRNVLWVVLLFEGICEDVAALIGDMLI